MSERNAPRPPERKPPERIEKRDKPDTGFPPPPDRTPKEPIDQTPKKSRKQGL
jgi:hypothetical protein